MPTAISSPMTSRTLTIGFFAEARRVLGPLGVTNIRTFVDPTNRPRHSARAGRVRWAQSYRDDP
jgi:hypothetical protein